MELIEVVFVYKFPPLTFGEVGEMLGLGALKQTRAYQEAQEEKQEQILEKMIPELLRRGLTVEEIAEDLKILVETVQHFVPQN